MNISNSNEFEYEYIVKNNAIIFNNNFNKPFDSSYKTLLSKYNELIIDRFSLYNYSFDINEVGTLPNINVLHFNERFNNSFNQNIFPELTVLVFGYRYNNYITFHPNCKIKFLSFGYRYYYQKQCMPCFTFGYFYNKPIDFSTVEHCVNISFGSKFNSSVVLPDRIKEFVMSDGFNKPFYKVLGAGANLSDGLFYSQSTCDTLECLTFGYAFNQNIDLRDFSKLRILTFGRNFNSNVLLPNSLSYLSFGFEFNKDVILPDNLISLVVNSDNYNLLSHIPNKVNFVRIGYNCDIDLIGALPNSVETIHVSKNYKHYDRLVAYYNSPSFESQQVLIVRNDSIP